MFTRVKESGRYTYLQIVHNERVNGKMRQRVIASLGRVDKLRDSGQLDRLAASMGRYSKRTAVLSAHRRGEIPPAQTVKIGPGLLFGRLWQELGIGEVLAKRLARRNFAFPVERAVFLTVLHRLFASGSDRATEHWRHGYRIAGCEELGLQHLYRAMFWLGEELPQESQAGASRFSPRTTKDELEEALFARQRDLFTTLDLVFFDTTSLYFEGKGGEKLGQYGHSKDKRPDRKQMVVGAVLDDQGRPLSSEQWPGNTTDVTTLLPVVDRLRKRFGVKELCVVADRGMITKDTVAKLRKTDGVHYILGARMRSVKEVRDEVLSRPGRYREVRGPRKSGKDPAPLKVKQVNVGDRRYIVCLNEEQAAQDRANREAIVASLREQLKQGDKSLVGNKGYRRYLKAPEEGRFQVDEGKLAYEARFDGKWVLTTDLDDLDAAEVALRYKQLWEVEDLFSDLKSLLQTRPVYHSSDEAIRGHVFSSFLALLLLHELRQRMAARGWTFEWGQLKEDLDNLEDIWVENDGTPFWIRSTARGDVGKALQAVGVALGPTVRFAGEDNPEP